jgi:hypothetical protein
VLEGVFMASVLVAGAVCSVLAPRDRASCRICGALLPIDIGTGLGTPFILTAFLNEHQ